MVPHSHLGPRTRLRVRRGIRRSVTTAAVLAVGVAAPTVLGWWAVAGLASFAVVLGLISGLAALDAWPGGRHPSRSVVVVTQPRSPRPSDHVAFAQALTAVASAYLSACEREERRP
jgi:hypothetical protein